MQNEKEVIRNNLETIEAKDMTLPELMKALSQQDQRLDYLDDLKAAWTGADILAEEINNRLEHYSISKKQTTQQ